MYRTDMAVESVCSGAEEGFKPRSVYPGVLRTDIIVDTDERAAAFGKARGSYITIECRELFPGAPDRAKNTAKALGAAIAGLIKKAVPGKRDVSVLVAGLGNRGMTADALGSKVAEALIVTGHLKEHERAPYRKLCAVCPGVLGQTGIESFDVISGVCGNIKPDLVIAVDTLAGRKTERLASAFQVTDTGITPGSGVGNHRYRLNRDTLGVPVIAVGVPLVVYASTIVNDVLDAAGNKGECCKAADAVISKVLGDLVVTPKDIDVIIKECAYVIALAINTAVHGNIGAETLSELMAQM